MYSSKRLKEREPNEDSDLSKERSLMMQRSLFFMFRILTHILFMIYSGVLLFTLGVPYYLWFIWVIYMITQFVDFVWSLGMMVFEDSVMTKRTSTTREEMRDFARYVYERETFTDLAKLEPQLDGMLTDFLQDKEHALQEKEKNSDK